MKYRYYVYPHCLKDPKTPPDFVVQTLGKLCYCFRNGAIISAFWGVPKGMVEVGSRKSIAALRKVMARNGVWRTRNRFPLT